MRARSTSATRSPNDCVNFTWASWSPPEAQAKSIVNEASSSHPHTEILLRPVRRKATKLVEFRNRDSSKRFDLQTSRQLIARNAIGTRTVAMLALVGVTIGCGVQTEPKKIGAAFQMETPIAAIVLVDWTGSYLPKQTAMRQAADLFEQYARPGDTWTFRCIGQGSYGDDCWLLSIRLPKFQSKTSHNPFDRKARAQRRHDEAIWKSVVDQTATTLRSTRVKSFGETDILGALAKAAEALAAAPKGNLKLLVCFTDLEENVFRDAAIDLRDVKVVFALTDDKSDAKKAQRLKSEWKHRLELAGAQVVTFYDPVMGSLGTVSTGREEN